uniref:Uncharacterized protein n=1 Tax=Knipowitschia caucasica TaxID=637954 RepID=A0AAV2MPK3_KNICA
MDGTEPDCGGEHEPVRDPSESADTEIRTVEWVTQLTSPDSTRADVADLLPLDSPSQADCSVLSPLSPPRSRLQVTARVLLPGYAGVGTWGPVPGGFGSMGCADGGLNAAGDKGWCPICP